MRRATRQKLSALRSLADHPKTPENERKSAMARIREIEWKVRSEEDRRRELGRSAMPTSMADMADRVSRKGLARFKRHVRDRAGREEEIIHDEWPFGWTGPKEKLNEIETGRAGDGGYSIGWKCPDCGDHVTRHISHGIMFRFESNPDALKELIDKIVSGETNHLCVACWRKWNER